MVPCPSAEKANPGPLPCEALVKSTFVVLATDIGLGTRRSQVLVLYALAIAPCAWSSMLEAARAHELLERGGYAGKVVLVTSA